MSAEEERSLVQRMYAPGSFPLRLMGFLQSSHLQFLLTMLLVLDVVIVVAELFIDAEFPACTLIVRDSISCCDAFGTGTGAGTGASGRSLAPGDALCSYPLVDSPAHTTGCDPYKHSGIKMLQLVLFICSAFILCVYEVELMMLLSVLRSNFVRNKLYLIDFVVVTTALVLEFTVKLKRAAAAGSDDDQAKGDLAGVLTIARCWRFVRLGHGLVSSMHEAHAGHLEEMDHHVQEVRIRGRGA